MTSVQHWVPKGSDESLSNKPGRNDPCPCGSGKKYKRCCLPTDEAAARERSQRALFDDDAFRDSEFDTDDEDEGFVDMEDDVPIVDVRSLTRVCYRRGFVTKLSEQVGNPIQVDLIDLETDSDIMSIEVFNRAIVLVHGDREEVRRVHRVCGVLEAASSDGS